MIITVDFETFYDKDYSLSSMSIITYVKDPRFKVHMVGIKVDEGPTFVCEGSKIPELFTQINWGDVTVLCHNTVFDATVLEHHYGVKPARYLDTRGMSCWVNGTYMRSHSLDSLGKYEGSTNKKMQGVLSQTKGMETLRGDLYEKTAEYCAADVDTCYELYNKLRAKLAAPELVESIIDWTIKIYTRPFLRLNRAQLQNVYDNSLHERDYNLSIASLTLEGRDLPPKVLSMLLMDDDIIHPVTATIPEDLRAVGCEYVINYIRRVVEYIEAHPETTAKLNENTVAALEMCVSYEMNQEDVEYVRSQIASAPKFAAVLRGLGVDVPMKIGKRGPIPALAKSDEGMKKLLEHPDKTVSDLAQLRLKVSSNIVRTRAERLISLADANDSAFHISLNAFGAQQTGRYSGGDKANPQNLSKRAGLELRACVEPPEGHALCAVDLSNIEPRLLALVAGDTELLKAFADREDPYKLQAAEFYSVDVDEVTKEQRNMGKVQILLLGYQSGADKFFETTKHLYGIPIEYSVAKEAVDSYRTSRAPVVALWRRLQDGIEEMMALPEGQHGSMISEDANLCFVREGVKQIDSGFVIKYPHLRKSVMPKLVKDVAEDGRLVDTHWEFSEQYVCKYSEEDELTWLIKNQGDAVREHCKRLGITVKMLGSLYHQDRQKLRQELDNIKLSVPPEDLTSLPVSNVYGGRVAENICQHLAGLILNYALASLNKQAAKANLTVSGKPWMPSLNVHDELVYIAPHAQIMEYARWVSAIIKTLPPFIKNLPIDCEVGAGPNYASLKKLDL